MAIDTDTDFPTAVDPELADEQLDRQARVAAVVEWNELPTYRQPYVKFDDLLEKHRRRLTRHRERQTARSGP